MIYIDGDSCSKRNVIERLAKKYGVECHIFCNIHTYITSEYSTVHVVDEGRDVADFAIVNKCNKGDIVITRDSGLAAMALAKKSFVVNPKGFEFTPRNIDSYLASRYIRNHQSKKDHNIRVKGMQQPRHPHSDFEYVLECVIQRTIGGK